MTSKILKPFLQEAASAGTFTSLHRSSPFHKTHTLFYWCNLTNDILYALVECRFKAHRVVDAYLGEMLYAIYYEELPSKVYYT